MFVDDRRLGLVVRELYQQPPFRWLSDVSMHLQMVADDHRPVGRPSRLISDH